MNNLSWLLYAAEAFEGLKVAGGIASPLSILVAGLVGIVAALNRFDKDIGGGERVAAPLFKAVRTLVVVGVISGLVAIVAPSRNTIMLIAASEVGETVLASEQAQELGGEAGQLATDSLRVLRKFINAQLEEPAE